MEQDGRFRVQRLVMAGRAVELRVRPLLFLRQQHRILPVLCIPYARLFRTILSGTFNRGRGDGAAQRKADLVIHTEVNSGQQA